MLKANFPDAEKTINEVLGQKPELPATGTPTSTTVTE
jgi:hypothetical protein